MTFIYIFCLFIYSYLFLKNIVGKVDIYISNVLKSSVKIDLFEAIVKIDLTFSTCPTLYRFIFNVRIVYMYIDLFIYNQNNCVLGLQVWWGWS